MASLNINSLLAHIEKLLVFMSSSKINLLFINETKLDLTIYDSDLYLPGFELIRNDRVSEMGVMEVGSVSMSDVI